MLMRAKLTLCVSTVFLFLLGVQKCIFARKYYKIMAWGGDTLHMKLTKKKITTNASLKNLCSKGGVHAVFISAVEEFYYCQKIAFPKLNLGAHCKSTFKPSKDNGDTDEILQCPEIGRQISFCQKNKVLVFLTIVNKSSAFRLKPSDAKDAARAIWDMFLGGNSKYRPFGNVKLDGINLMIRDRIEGYLELSTELRILMNQHGAGKTYQLAISPSAGFPDGYCGPNVANGALQRPELFDIISLHALSSPNATFKNQRQFWKSLSAWNEWAEDLASDEDSGPDLYLGVPATPYAIGAPGDHIPLNDAVSRNFFPRFKRLKNFVGLHFLDYNLDSQYKVTKKLTYSEALMELLNNPKKLKQAHKGNVYNEKDDDRHSAAINDDDLSDEEDFSDGSDYGKRPKNGSKKKGKKDKALNWGMDFDSAAFSSISGLGSKICYFVLVVMLCLLF